MYKDIDVDARLDSEVRSIGGIAEYYGVSVPTIKKWLRMKGIDYSKRGSGSILFTLSELREIVAAIGD